MVGRRTVGVLALQGAFAKHLDRLTDLGVQGIEIRQPQQLENCDALIIPGGESTTIRKQLEFYDFFPELARFAQERPVLGTCAGLILMAKEIEEEGPALGLIDITASRNAYGRQAESFSTSIVLPCGSHIPAIFIRAPQITRVGPDVKVLASHQGNPVWVKQGHHMAATFHPELSNSCAIHQAFLEAS